MIRPTQEEVDEALRTVREETLGSDDPGVLLDVLADEVVALREELKLAQEHAKAEAQALVVSLLDEWRSDINAALRGGS